jgi:hypothetical protein
LDSVEIADTVSYEGGIRAMLFNRLDLHGNLWRADNSNEVRGIPPGGVQFESVGKSRRNGGGVDAKVFIGPVTRAFASLSWLDVRLLTPVTPPPTSCPTSPISCTRLASRAEFPCPAARVNRSSS